MLTIEQLEDRNLPAPLTHVQVDTLVIGNDPDASQLNALLTFCVTTAMPQLLGVYGINQGTFGVSDAVPYPGPVIYDGDTTQGPQVTQIISQEIATGHLSKQDMIVVLIAPGIKVENPSLGGPFLGYHSAFPYQGVQVPYAVIPYPQAPNTLDPNLPTQTSLEVSVTHELEEALANFTLTMPNRGEIGDKYDRQWFFDNGWHIQVAEGPQGQMLALGPINQEPPPAPSKGSATPQLTDFVALSIEEFWLDAYTLLAHINPVYTGQQQQAQEALVANPANQAANSEMWRQLGDKLFYQVLTGDV